MKNRNIVSHPPFDKELSSKLPDILKKMPVPLTADLISESRSITAKSTLLDHEIRRNGAFDFKEVEISSYDNAKISLIICWPTLKIGPYPVIYNIHGGGMVAGNNRTPELSSELKRAEELQFAVVSVNYRLAPEYPDPTPLKDCYEGLKWLVKNSKTFNLNAEQIVISGNSAGGGLAAGVTLLARDLGSPKIFAQMLQCPMLNDKCDTISATQMRKVGIWDTISNLTGWTALLGKRRGTDEVSYYAAPARSDNFSGLPPTFIDVGSVESLRDDALDYANGIWQAGGIADLHVWGGAFHSFDQWVPEAIISKSADKVRIEWIKRLFKNPG